MRNSNRLITRRAPWASFGIAITFLWMGWLGATGCEYATEGERVRDTSTTTETAIQQTDTMKSLEQQLTDLRNEMAQPQEPDQATQDGLKALQDQNALIQAQIAALEEIIANQNQPPATTDEGGGTPPSDTTPLTVTSTYPTSNTTVAPTQQGIYVTFSEKIDPASVTKDSLTFTHAAASNWRLQGLTRIAALFEGTAHAWPNIYTKYKYKFISVTLDATIASVDTSGNPSIGFMLDKALSADKSYTMTLHKEGITDLATKTKSLADNKTWSFKTMKEAKIVAEDKEPPAGEPAEETAVPTSKEVVGLKLMVLTGWTGETDSGQTSGTCGKSSSGTDTSGKIMFDLCKTENFNDPATCFRAKFNDNGFLNLNPCDYETLDFTQHPELIDTSRKAMAELQYPDDFKYFRFASDPGNTVEDAWYLQGVELYVKPKGENWMAVYVNPCVGRWIEQESGHNVYSPHSIENDDAFCVYLETGSGGSAQNDDSTVYAVVPMNQNEALTQSTLSWINSYTSSAVGESPVIEYTTGASSFRVPLHYSGWNDFGDDDDDDQFGASYPFTVYNGEHRMAESKIRIQTGGSDWWTLHRIRAYHFKPGNKDFLETQKCLFYEEEPNNFGLSTDSGEGSTYFPKDGYATLLETTCGELSNIQRGSCKFAFSVFTKEWPDLNCSYGSH